MCTRLMLAITGTILLTFQNRTRLIVAIGWLCVAADPALFAAEPDPLKRVLLIHQTAGRPFRARFDTAFIDVLRNGDAPIDLYEEAVEAWRFPGPDQSRFLREYLRQKYAGTKIDVLVATGNVALAFARDNRAMFGNPPIVATLSPTGTFDEEDDMTGLQGGQWIGETIDLALALRPETENVFVVDGSQDNNADLQIEVERQLEAHGRPLNLVYLQDLPLAEVVSRLNAAPEQSIVLYVRQTIRTRTEDLGPLEGLSHVVRASRVPVFSQSEEWIGRGVLGGYMWRFEEDARRMAAMAKSIAGGVRARDIPVERTTIRPILDWRQLQHWNISDARVPAGSIVLFRPESFFERYRNYVAAGAVIFSVQLALIVGLLVQRIQRRRAERELRENEDRYRSVVDAQSELICRFLPDTTLTFVNDAYCRFWNQPRHELLGRKFIELVPPASRAAVLERISRLSRGSDSHEHQVTMPDGTIGWHHWINQAIVDGRGQLVELQGVGRDVTDRRRAEEAVGQLEKRNTAVLRAIPDLMFVLQRDGTYVDYHARDPKLLFLPPEHFIGKRVLEIMPRETAQILMDAIERACLSEEPVVVEYVLPMREPRYFEARVVYAGENRVLSIVRDVTEAKRATELNRDLVGRLITAQEAERTWIARELHDGVLQDLAAVSVDLSHLRQKGADLRSGDSHESLLALQHRMSTVAENLRLLSHGLHPSVLHHIGLVAALQAHCAEFERQQHIRVRFFADTHDEPVSQLVSLSFFRMAQEALRNTARHGQARHATVSLVRDDGYLTLAVTDDGRGFDVAAARQNGGLGLVSIEERARLVQGRVSIDSTRGRGTRIDVRVPVDVVDRADGPRPDSVGVIRPSAEGPWLSAE